MVRRLAQCLAQTKGFLLLTPSLLSFQTSCAHHSSMSGHETPLLPSEPPLRGHPLPMLALCHVVASVFIRIHFLSCYFYLHTTVDPDKIIHSYFSSFSLLIGLLRPLLSDRHLLGRDTHGRHLPLQRVTASLERLRGQ